MSRTPFITGDLIEYYGIQALVVKDFGMETLVVYSSLTGKEEIWQYDFEGRVCQLVRSVTDVNNVIVTKSISFVDGVVEINIDLVNIFQNDYGPKCRILLNGVKESPLWDNTI